MVGYRPDSTKRVSVSLRYVSLVGTGRPYFLSRFGNSYNLGNSTSSEIDQEVTYSRRLDDSCTRYDFRWLESSSR